MRVLLGWFETASTRRPGSVIAALVVLTVGFAALASTNEIEVDLAQLGSEDSEAVQARDRIHEQFGDPTAAVQVIIDAGPGGDMLTADGLEAMTAAEEVAVEALGSALRTGEDGQPQSLSLQSALGAVLARQGRDLAAVDDAEIGALAAGAVTGNPQLAALVSDDLNVAEGTARGAVILLLLDQELSESERSDAGERVQASFEERPAGVPADVEVTVFSSGLFVSGLLEAIRAEVPLLFGLALLVVLAILGLAYRSVFDVAVGFAGLVATVVWTFGLVALLGPANLGWTGPPTQLAVIVPVLLVGLGIDYSVHLTARYREQRAAGQRPPAAAGRALQTVGAALVLATAATAIGFASIATAPVQLLADFGVFIAIGVVCAFVLMALLVPAARVLRDRRQLDAESTAVRELGLSRLMDGPARLAVRRPWAGMLVSLAVVVLSLAAATGLDVEFDRDDFIPEGSGIEAVLAHQQELFGGGVTESTHVVVDGDFTDPSVATAVWHAQQAVGDVEGVRSVGGTPQVLSVMTMLAVTLGAEGVAPADADPQQDPGAFAALPPGAGWDGGGFAQDADLAGLYAMLREAAGAERVSRLLTPDADSGIVQIRTTAGDTGAERVQREIELAFAPVERAGASVTVTSEPIIIAEMSDELSAFQIQAIVLTLVVVLVLLTGYATVTRRRPLLGVIAMIPATVGASLVLGTMWVLGTSFNVITATLTAIAVGIGVPYGVHVANRFSEDLEVDPGDEAVARTLRSTGGALAGSALTTLGAFVVLAFSGLPPIRSLGLLGGAGIVFALLAAVLVEPGALVLWARRNRPQAEISQPRVPAETGPQR